MTRSAGTEQAFVRSLERGPAVIRAALSLPRPGLAITEVAEATGADAGEGRA